MKLYERGLQKSCYKVANRFEDEDMRLAGTEVCGRYLHAEGPTCINHLAHVHPA